MVKKIYEKLTCIGITTETLHEEHIKTRLSNTITLISILVTAPFTLIYTLLGNIWFGIGIIPLICCYFSILLLNKKHYFHTARLLSILFPTLGVLIYSFCLGTQTGIHLIFIPTIPLSYLYFSGNQKKWFIIAITIPILLFITIDVFSELFPTTTTFHPILLKMHHIISIIITCTFILLSLKIYAKQQIKKYQDEIKIQQNIKNDLNQTILELDHKNTIIENYAPKEAYIAMTKGIAHELRSPMAILLSGARLLKDNIHNDQSSAIEFADIMITTMKKLEKLTTSMLKLNKPTTDNACIFEFQEIIHDVLTLIEFQCKKKKIKLNHSIESQEKIYGNKEFISQAILNIIVNAIQHSPPKSTIHITLQTKTNQHVTLYIRDEGEGISEANITTIFEPEKTSNKNEHNSGLGLAFVKRVIDEHKATITTSSTIGKGTTFIITWPSYSKDKIPQFATNTV
ncbi:hypothetical protein DID76_01020 [Candidatus Marinamargulisbacteria bacterium SCGC AG-414-C22]|nr:hypothetical protein DID76_01020 [Candidatus Marinamargulisbacteria bacterium SCGC AG-414-C22]